MSIFFSDAKLFNWWIIMCEQINIPQAIICIVASQIANLGESMIGAVFQEKEGFQWVSITFSLVASYLALLLNSVFYWIPEIIRCRGWFFMLLVMPILRWAFSFLCISAQQWCGQCSKHIYGEHFGNSYAAFTPPKLAHIEAATQQLIYQEPALEFELVRCWITWWLK